MKRCSVPVLIWIIVSGLSHSFQHDPAPVQHFRLTYLFQMDLAGHLLLVVPYRSYFEASASVELTAEKKIGQNMIFGLSSIDRTGYLISTGGLTATSLYFFTADSNEGRRESFYHQKLERFRHEYPGDFSRFTKIRNRPMSILTAAPGDFLFERDAGGTHMNCRENITLTDSHSMTYANIYGILGVLVKLFNHRIFPAGHGSHESLSAGQVWRSSPLDYSRLLAETTGLTSQYAEKEVKPKQKGMIFLEYRVKQISDSLINILGRSEPLAPFWKGMRVKLVEREIVMDRKNGGLVRDEVRFVIWGSSKRKGRIHVCLERQNR